MLYKMLNKSLLPLIVVNTFACNLIQRRRICPKKQLLKV